MVAKKMTAAQHKARRAKERRATIAKAKKIATKTRRASERHDAKMAGMKKAMTGKRKKK